MLSRHQLSVNIMKYYFLTLNLIGQLAYGKQECIVDCEKPTNIYGYRLMKYLQCKEFNLRKEREIHYWNGSDPNSLYYQICETPVSCIHGNIMQQK